MTSNNPFQLNGKVALVTGAGKGIGRACALALAQAGADIILGLRDASSGQEVVEEIRQMGREVLPVQMDVAKMDEITSAVAAGVARFGRIDILVKSATTPAWSAAS